MTAAVADGPTDEGSPDRLLTLSDGIYAIAMTLLVLNVEVPEGLDEAGLRHALAQLWPQLAAYVASFSLLGAFWRDHRRLFLRVRRIDGTLGRLTVASLGAVALLPFPTTVLAEYRLQTPAVALYAAAITLITALHLAIAATLRRRRHLQAERIADELGRAVVRDLAATVIVFALSVPVAFVSPPAAVCLWVLLVPVKIVTGRWARAAHRDGGGPSRS